MSMKETVYVNATQPHEIRPPRGGRSYFFLQNPSAASIFYSEDTMATAENGIEVAAGQFTELHANMGDAVPQGNVWLLGASVAPTQQRVLVKHG